MRVLVLHSAVALPPPAARPWPRGAVSVIGGGMAQACAKAALAGQSDAAAINECDMALEIEDLDTHDRAGTYINRGVMELRRDLFEPARADFDRAIAIAPGIGEAWVNRGAAMVGEKRYEDGLANIDKAIALGVKEPEKAWFNRALAHEGLDDEKDAYFDYQQALKSEARLGLPERELRRFTVSRQ